MDAPRVTRRSFVLGGTAAAAVAEPGRSWPIPRADRSAQRAVAVAAARAQARPKDVLSVAYLAGFPPADLYDCGPSVVVYAWTQAAADAAADALLRDIEAREAEFAQPLLQPDEAVQQAMRIAETATRPVVIADTQDNPGAGGTGDTTGLLAALGVADVDGLYQRFTNLAGKSAQQIAELYDFEIRGVV